MLACTTEKMRPHGIPWGLLITPPGWTLLEGRPKPFTMDSQQSPPLGSPYLAISSRVL